MNNQLISLTKELVAIRSNPDNAQALTDCLKTTVSYLKGYTVEYFEKNGVKSALIYNRPKRPKRFKVILNGHLDIIPGKEHQYTPTIKGNKLYGVGTMDMKASIASFITVFDEVAKKVNYPLGIQLVTDEETGGFNGTKYQIDKGIRADFVIVGETTNFSIENEAKGILWVKVTAKGKAAHGAYPWKGENAIGKINQFLTLLEKRFPSPKRKTWITTVNVARVVTNNQTFNKIPDDCEVWLDIRYIPQDAPTIVSSIKKLIPKGCTLHVVLKEPAQFVNKKSPYLQQLQKTGKKVYKKIPLNQGQGSSDARHFTRVGCEAIEFGPLGGGMGTDDEWVDIKSLTHYSEVLKQFLLSQ